MSSRVLTAVVVTMVLVWAYSAVRARRYYRKGASPYVLFCISPLIAALGALLGAGLGAIALASLVVVPTTLRALARLAWKREVQVHLVLAEQVEEDIAVQWVTTTYQPDYTLRGRQAAWYWADQLIIGIVLYGGFLALLHPLGGPR
jgi:hypothetical protein